MFFCIILYIILILALLVVAILFTYYSAYLALILALVIPAVFLVILIVNRFCIKYNSYVDTVSVVKGDRIKFNFELINKGPFPSGNIRTYLELYYGDEKRINKVIDTDIMPFSSRKRTLEITAEYTGDLKIVRKKVLLLDYFKLFSFKLSKNNKVFNFVGKILYHHIPPNIIDNPFESFIYKCRPTKYFLSVCFKIYFPYNPIYLSMICFTIRYFKSSKYLL